MHKRYHFISARSIIFKECFVIHTFLNQNPRDYAYFKGLFKEFKLFSLYPAVCFELPNANKHVYENQ